MRGWQATLAAIIALALVTAGSGSHPVADGTIDTGDTA